MRWMWIAAAALISAPMCGAETDWIVVHPNEEAGPIAPDAYFDVDWAGGSAQEYYQGVAEVFSERANLIIAEVTSGVQVPAFDVKGISPGEVIEMPTRLTPNLIVQGLDSNPKLRADAEWKATVIVTGFGSADNEDDAGSDRFNLSFAGGTVRQYVNAIRAQRPDANVVLMPGAEGFTAPPVELSNVSIGAALGVVDGQMRMHASGQQSISVDRLPDGSRALYRLTVHGRAENPPQTRVWSVAEILENGMPAEDLLTAVEAALQLYDSPSKMQFHEQTSLLLMRGPGEQLQAVERVLGEVQNAAGVQAHVRDRRAEDLRQFERQIAERMSEYEIMREDLMILERIVERMKREAEQDRVDPVQVAEKERELVRVRGEMRRLQREIQMLEDERDRIRGSSDSESSD